LAQSKAIDPGPAASGRRRPHRFGLFAHLAAVVGLSALLVFAIELTVRGSLAPTMVFLFEQPFRPGLVTIALFALTIIGLDALLGRRLMGLLLVAPLSLLLAFIGQQKSLYLGDPLYPADFLYSRQIVQLMPLLARERPLTAATMAAGLALAALCVAALWRAWRRHGTPLTCRSRVTRLAAVVPALAFFVSIMDYQTFSWARDRLQIIPMMWDQKENYNSNGFALAFALNVPMAKVGAPAGYGEKAVTAIAAPETRRSVPGEAPDIIMVMSESFWDPTRLPGVRIAPDPIPTVRTHSSGKVFSPEFGGMTANVEFEALTGFSNAFLPYGSIPYQQYVRASLPSLAAFLGSEGYATRAIHPFEGWFWNRETVYDALGFDRFMSVEKLPALAKRGPLVSDAALTSEIIREADMIVRPFFFFAVTLQNHGPYEPNRYDERRLKVRFPPDAAARESIRSFAEGMRDADDGLAVLLDWAARRQRPTVIAFFGDHLPPLGPVYPATGMLEGNVAPRKGTPEEMAAVRETPLVIWSNRTGVQSVGTVSPALLPYHVLTAAGISHPYYTGFLGRVREGYGVVERGLLIGTDGKATTDWSRADAEIDPLIRDYRMLQYDMLFGKRHGAQRFFPETVPHKLARASRRL
jgi:phosphoglycerol transferase MdoB-like AlkP superfamily enzyme